MDQSSIGEWYEKFNLTFIISNIFMCNFINDNKSIEPFK